MGKRFELRTDHNGLKYRFGHPTLNSRQRRWLEFICEYEFDIKHIKGKEKKVVDALSRRVHELHATTIIMYQIDIKGIIPEATKEYFHPIWKNHLNICFKISRIIQT